MRTAIVLTLALVGAACSSGTEPSSAPTTVLLTDSFPFDVVVFAYAPTGISPFVLGEVVPLGSQSCIAFDRSTLEDDWYTVYLDLYDGNSGDYLTSTSINLANHSWAWDGSHAPTTAPSCGP